MRAVREARLDTTAKAVAFSLGTFADGETGACYPSQVTIASAAGLSPSNVTPVVHAIERLKARGFVAQHRSPRASRNGPERTSKRASHTYILTFPTPQRVHAAADAVSPSDNAPNPAADADDLRRSTKYVRTTQESVHNLKSERRPPDNERYFSERYPELVANTLKDIKP
jgi:hypothetical protein